MRGFLGVLLVLAACAAPQLSEGEQAARCVQAFERYDRAVLVDLIRPGLLASVTPGVPGIVSPRLGAESALRQFACVLQPRDVPSTDALPAGPGTGADGAMVVHVALVSGNEAAAQLADGLQRAGYPVRTVFADRLGRRIFVGPLSEGAAQQVTLALRAAGFDAAYPASRRMLNVR